MSELIMPAEPTESPPLPPLVEQIKDTMQESYKRQESPAWCANPFTALQQQTRKLEKKEPLSPQECGATWAHMNTHMLIALHRMGYSTKPELTQELMTCPKAQMNECMRLQKILQEQSILHSTLAILHSTIRSMGTHQRHGSRISQHLYPQISFIRAARLELCH